MSDMLIMEADTRNYFIAGTGVMLRSRLVNRMGRTGTPAVTKSLQGNSITVTPGRDEA